MFDPGSRLCGYLRDSGGRTQELSTDQQEQKLAQFCQDNGLLLTRVFRDDAISGGKVVGRRAFLEMIDYLESGAPEVGVLLWSYSRFSRDYDDTQYFLARLRKAGKAIHSLSDSVPDTLDGRMLESMIAWKNAKYREDLARDISRGLEYMVHSRRVWSGGSPPTGYQLEPVDGGSHRDGRPRHNSRLVIDPLTAPQVRLAFEMRARNDTLGEIMAACPLLPEDRSSVAYLLRNPIYIGTGIFNGVEIPNYCAPLIDLVTWQAAQAVNQRRSGGRGPNHPRAVRSIYLLGGLINCRVCGLPMFGQHFVKSKTQHSYEYYRCRSNYENRCGARMIPKDELEEMVIGRLIDVVLRPDILRDLIAEQKLIQDGQSERQGERVAAINAELDVLSARIERLVKAIGDHGHSRALLAELAELEEQERQVRVRLAEVESHNIQGELPDPELLSRQSIKLLHAEAPRIKKEILQSFIASITAERLEDDRIEGSMRYRLPAGELVGTIEL